MNRIKLLALAREQGYTGKDEDALAWIKSNLNLADRKTGKALDVDAVWNTKPTLSLGDSDDATSDDASAGQKSATATANAAGGTVTITEAEAAQFREFKSGARRQQRDASDFNGRLAEILEGEKRLSVLNSPEGIKRYSARKAYERKIASGKAVFDTVDHIEAFNAHLRLTIAHAKNMTYKGRQFDIDVVKAWSGTVNELGGVLVPQEFEAVLMYATEMYGLARQIANVVPMKGDIKIAPRLTAIPAMAHRAPGAAITPADAATDNVKLTADSVGVILKFDSELMEDSAISIGDTAARIVAEAYNYRVDQDYFIADGSSTYGGFRGIATGLVSGAYQNAAGNSWSSITKDNINTVIGNVENVDPSRVMGVCSRQFAWQVLQRLATATSQFVELVGSFGPMGCTWMGQTIKYSQVMPIVSASGSKVFAYGDFKGGSMIGERRDLRIDSSDQVYWANDQIGIKATARFAINTHGDGRGGTYGNIGVLQTT